jgi:hypothetical protein
MMVTVTYTRGGSKKELIVSSAYLPYDSDEPPLSKGLKEAIDYCSSNQLQLIVGCDANAHHIIWGSTDINQQGECLTEYLVSKNLSILNKGNESTFVISNRKEVIDLTLGTDSVQDVELAFDMLQQVILSSYHQNCQPRWLSRQGRFLGGIKS